MSESFEVRLRRALVKGSEPVTDVPPAPTDVILARWETRRQGMARRRLPRLIAGVAAGAILSVAGIAAASPNTAQVLHLPGLHLPILRLLHGSGRLVTDNLGFRYWVYQPASSGAPSAVAGEWRRVTLAQAQADMSFHVVVPAGLPSGSELVSILESPPMGVRTVTFQYRTASGDEFAISEGPSGPSAPLDMQGTGSVSTPSSDQVVTWVTDGTRVTILGTSALTAQELGAIRSAMGGGS